jgi:hypothetical protein
MINILHLVCFQHLCSVPFILSVQYSSFSMIPFMDLGDSVSLVIYLHPWSKSMALAHSI